jgi:hypothetical protein
MYPESFVPPLLLKELGFEHSSPTTVYEDNQSAIKLVKNPEGHGRTKHIDVRHSFVQAAHTSQDILLEYCPTNDQVADIFTKALAGPQFSILRAKLRVLSLAEWKGKEWHNKMGGTDPGSNNFHQKVYSLSGMLS